MQTPILQPIHQLCAVAFLSEVGGYIPSFDMRIESLWTAMNSPLNEAHRA